MGCKWYEWSCRKEEARKVIPGVLRQSHVRAEELLKRANLAMAVDCATMHRRGKCAQANKHCSSCQAHVEISKGNKAGWCNRDEYKVRCQKNFNANITQSGWCWISYFEESGDHVDCPVYKAWQGVILRAKKLWANTDYRLRNCSGYIYTAAGPEPGTLDYMFQDDDTNDPLSNAAMEREERAAAARAGRGDTIEAALDGLI